MDKDQVLTAIKKNWVSITMGVVALAAIGVMLFLINPRVEQVKKQTQQRAAKQDDILSQITKKRASIQVGSTSEADQNLGMFPTPRVIDWGKATMADIKAQANSVLSRAVERNVRAPLGFDTHDAALSQWPLEGEQKRIDRAGYRRDYALRINADNSFDPESGNYPPGTLQNDLGGTRPPTQAELAAKESGLEARLRAEATADQASAPAFAAEIARKRLDLSAQLRYERAARHLIYIDANSPSTGFSVHPIVNNNNPSAEDCFNAQVGLWVQETVGNNLVRANEQAFEQLPTERRNILGAPVKHLVAVDVPDGFTATANVAREDEEAAGQPPAGGGFGGGGARRGGGAQQQRPNQPAAPEEPAAIEVPIQPGANLEPKYQYSASGRAPHTPLYDLVQFNVTLRCAADQVPYVLTELQRGSLLSVLNVDMTVIDPTTAARDGYDYGESPVVQLDLQCEMLFLRSWLVPLMPSGTRQAIVDWEETATGSSGGAGNSRGGGGQR